MRQYPNAAFGDALRIGYQARKHCECCPEKLWISPSDGILHQIVSWFCLVHAITHPYHAIPCADTNKLICKHIVSDGLLCASFYSYTTPEVRPRTHTCICISVSARTHACPGDPLGRGKDHGHASKHPDTPENPCNPHAHLQTTKTTRKQSLPIGTNAATLYHLTVKHMPTQVRLTLDQRSMF